jgi:hypothetical protein
MTVKASQLACRIREVTRNLADEADAAGLATLAYLLEMTSMEAADTGSQRSRTIDGDPVRIH